MEGFFDNPYDDGMDDLMRDFRPAQKCSCGSGQYREILYDARGIECGYVCPKCKKEVTMRLKRAPTPRK